MGSNESIGEKIRRLRIARGLEQGDLAYRSGITQSHLSKIENGRTNTSLRVLENLSKALSVQNIIIF